MGAVGIIHLICNRCSNNIDHKISIAYHIRTSSYAYLKLSRQYTFGSGIKSSIASAQLRKKQKDTLLLVTSSPNGIMAFSQWCNFYQFCECWNANVISSGITALDHHLCNFYRICESECQDCLQWNNSFESSFVLFLPHCERLNIKIIFQMEEI